MSKKSESSSYQDRLRAQGLRATPARLALLKLMDSIKGPRTHADLATALEAMGVDKATVFRNLGSLVESGLVRRFDVGDHVWRYELLSEHPHGEELHPHFVCTDCGTVACLEAGQVSISEKSKRDLMKRTSEILLRGVCRTCETES